MILVSNAMVATAPLYSPDYLAHHGIKGMRWGIRRFQNEDGSLTPAGERRYGSVEAFRAHQNYKAAKKTYNKAFNKAYNKQHQAYSFKKSKRDANTKRWEDVYDAAKAEEQAKRKYKAELSKSGVTEKRKIRAKKIAKAGAIAAAAAIAAYGGYKLYQNAQANKAAAAEAAEFARRMESGRRLFSALEKQAREQVSSGQATRAAARVVLADGSVLETIFGK